VLSTSLKLNCFCLRVAFFSEDQSATCLKPFGLKLSTTQSITSTSMLKFTVCKHTVKTL
jgi:hypothetical protein